MKNKIIHVTLCCGNGKAKKVAFSTILNTIQAFCLKCNKETILLPKEEYKEIQKELKNIKPTKWEKEFATTLYFDHEEVLLRNHKSRKYGSLEGLLLYYLGYSPNYLTVTDKVKIKVRKGAILIEKAE